MNILIVDDDRFVISSLEKKIDWNSLGIEQIFSAYNIQQAKKIFSTAKVHLLLSDIEMPRGSGLELLAWIRSEGHAIQAIFLTNFADFNYAQKAIELQSFEYYLKPIEIDKLELILKKAIKMVRNNQSSENALRVGQYWQQNRQKLIDHFWNSFLINNEILTTEQLQEQLNLNTIPYSMEDYYLPILLDLYPYSIIDHTKIMSSFDSIKNLSKKLTSIIKQTFDESSLHFESLLEWNSNKEQILLIFKWRDYSREFNSTTEVKSSCKQLMNSIKLELNSDVQCSIGNSSTLTNISSHIKELQQMREETIDFRNKIFYFPVNQKNIQTYLEPNLQLLDDYIQSGNRLSFLHKCKQYLTNILEKNALNQHILCSFRLDITQLIFTHLKRKEILAHKLFHGNTSNFLQTQSSRSIEDLIQYISYLVDVSLDYIAFIDSQKSVVKTICVYMEENYQENITRDTIAKIVYLSPDYIARIFKKETGVSLVNYMIKKRIAVAKDLLTNTTLPVHIISDKVGYGNYSYFTKIFKKETNYAPVDYRKITRKQEKR
ncbi:MAG: response regulator [Bacillus sp. (in: firmicutes)]